MSELALHTARGLLGVSLKNQAPKYYLILAHSHHASKKINAQCRPTEMPQSWVELGVTNRASSLVMSGMSIRTPSSCPPFCNLTGVFFYRRKKI